MPLNPALVGRTYPPVRYEVAREKLREFALAVGEHDPLYHEEAAARAAGLPDLPAVPTFPVVVSYQVGRAIYADPELGLDYARVLHGEQEFVYERPVFAGDRLVATGRIDKVISRGRHETLTVEAHIEAETAAGGTEPVCVARSTIVVRGPEAERAGEPGEAVHVRPSEEPQRAGEPPPAAVPAAEGVGVPVGDGQA